MYGGIGSEWNERTNSSLLFWKDKIFRLFRGPISSEALPNPPCFLFWETLFFIGVLIFCAGNYKVFSWSEICFLMNADLRSSTENLSFTNWRRGRSEGRRFLAGIKWRMDFWCGRICICIYSVFYLCICVYRGIWVTDFECIRSASAGIYIIKCELCDDLVFIYFIANLRRRLSSWIRQESC